MIMESAKLGLYYVPYYHYLGWSLYSNIILLKYGEVH